MPEAVLEAEGLVYSYKAREGELPPRVLDGVDLSVRRGSFVAVLGHNGSGKSTLAKHFNALLAPVSGRMLVEGMDTADEHLTLEIRRRVGMVFQNPDNQIVASIVEEDVAFAPENLGCPPEDIRKRVDSALRAVGMSEYVEHAPHLLSGGQKQRVAIAGVLAMEPDCVVFDEPTAMLDPRGRESVVGIIRSMCDEMGVTVVLITHHMEEAIRADRVVVMSDGRVVMDGKPREIFTQADALSGYGLGVPETVSLLRGLREDGFNVPLGALTVDECADAIMAAVSGAVSNGS
ncbi:MAG: energy-coupling factor transporter ATPase [Oscillospiraceae bacterium]|jgi:energy-coupling factor transport system ATP-binding protein|nr:energy-coupling factor transporter ATPase [Oscillospiraceae bacterium]